MTTSDTTLKKRCLDMTSPYYLHPSDHTSMKLVPDVLKGNNYQEWEQTLRNSFRARCKLAFIDGRITQPAETDAHYDDWCSVNSMMVGWILQTVVDSSIGTSLFYCDSVKVLCDEIQQRFSIRKAPRIHQLRTEISHFRQNGQNYFCLFWAIKTLTI
ncbi:hypothetical protein QQ045_029661 [Rhodiola kirilowii]